MNPKAQDENNKDPSPPDIKSLRILSYNIHKGFNANNSAFVLKEIRQAIRNTNADLVFLQEVLGDHLDHGRKHSNWIPGSQFEYLADSIWTHFAYGKNAIYQQGHHGNAILSKYPFSYWENTDISRFSFSQRGILHGVINNTIHVFCIHLGLLGIERQTQLKSLIQCVSEKVPEHSPLIIAGDFNDWSRRIDRQICKKLKVTDAYYSLHGRHLRTFPAAMPLLPMDRVYFRNLDVSSVQRQMDSSQQKLSDHCGIVAEFTLPD